MVVREFTDVVFVRLENSFLEEDDSVWVDVRPVLGVVWLLEVGSLFFWGRLP